MIGITKNQVIETAFEIIKESIEWGIEEDGKTYGNFIDGVVTMADNLFNKINEE